MPSINVNLPSIKSKNVKYTQGVGEAVRAAFAEFGIMYAEPALKILLFEFRFTGNLEKEVYSYVRKTNNGYSLIISSRAKDEQGNTYLSMLDTGKPNEVSYAKLKEWVKRKITDDPKVLKRVTNKIRSKLAVEGPEPKDFLDEYIDNLQDVCHDVYPKLLMKHLARLRRSIK